MCYIEKAWVYPLGIINKYRNMINLLSDLIIFSCKWRQFSVNFLSFLQSEVWSNGRNLLHQLKKCEQTVFLWNATRKSEFEIWTDCLLQSDTTMILEFCTWTYGDISLCLKPSQLWHASLLQIRRIRRKLERDFTWDLLRRGIHHPPRASQHSSSH